MLKDKYTFKLQLHEVVELDDALSGTFIRHGSPKETEVKLLISLLAKVKGRLHGKMFMPKKVTSMYLNDSEALAFHLAYQGSIVCFNVTTARIFTEIDKTLS